MGIEFCLHLPSSDPGPVLCRDSGTEGMGTCSIIAVLSPGDQSWLGGKMMPTVLGKIPAGKDGIFSARWGSRRTGHAHCAVGLRMSWTRALTMPRTALLPSLRPVPGPALALNLLIRLKPTGGWGPCLSDLPCPIWSSCWLIPGAYFPESCLGHPGKPVPTSPLCKCFGV